MLKINRDVYEKMVEHSLAEMPLEACGYLGLKDGAITTCYKMTNTDSAGDHFTMDPKEQFAVTKESRNKGEKLAVVYHSHPESPSRPSEEDKKLAYDSSVSYVIISLADKEPVVKSFLIKDGDVTEEEIHIND